ncbi:MAG: hypothetical protein V4708_01105 [Bacteroidota bacterium]
MKNLLCLVILLLVATVSSAQDIHFYDVHGKKISKEQFEKQRDSRVNLALSFQKGKTTETRLFLRSKTGFISQEVLNKIISNLQTVTGKSIDRSEMMIINYHQGKDRCNSSGGGGTFQEMKAALAKYRSQIGRLGQTSEYNMYATKEGLKENYGLVERYPDLDLLVEKTFFKYKYPCSSFVIIKPDGEYYAYYGEYMQEHLIKQAKILLK